MRNLKRMSQLKTHFQQLLSKDDNGFILSVPINEG